ncbi:hypothetical protein [Actinoplanes derwentensis]|uniref:Uncharacterized protein n=1 Tax=Actinoplanes derwentensis TaxID=113562 RepID=A0A1H2C7Y8_9ACTN|nr:hypothetical protein [Actinoplanes derwentensis]GID86528.1 hypothetical protein Ade03nite_54520 [Actinoplanes derwentensis]SDT66645.1 hypothetical protein SAMN04489716_5372 [Actinoplanes derwentensis]
MALPWWLGGRRRPAGSRSPAQYDLFVEWHGSAAVVSHSGDQPLLLWRLLRNAATPSGDVLVMTSDLAVRDPACGAVLRGAVEAAARVWGAERVWVAADGIGRPDDAHATWLMRLAERTGVELLAPDGPVHVTPDGTLYAAGGTGAWGWRSFRPGTVCPVVGNRHPIPDWEHALADRPVALPGLVADPLPAGVLIRASTAAPAVPGDPAYDLPVDPRGPALVLRHIGEPPVDPAYLAGLFTGLPAHSVVRIETGLLDPARALPRSDWLDSLAANIDSLRGGPVDVFRDPFRGPAAPAGPRRSTGDGPALIGRGWVRTGDRLYRHAAEDELLAEVIPAGILLRAAGAYEPDGLAFVEPDDGVLALDAAASDRLVEMLCRVVARTSGEPGLVVTGSADHPGAARLAAAFGAAAAPSLAAVAHRTGHPLVQISTAARRVALPLQAAERSSPAAPEEQIVPLVWSGAGEAVPATRAPTAGTGLPTWAGGSSVLPVVSPGAAAVTATDTGEWSDEWMVGESPTPEEPTAGWARPDTTAATSGWETATAAPLVSEFWQTPAVTAHSTAGPPVAGTSAWSGAPAQTTPVVGTSAWSEAPAQSSRTAAAQAVAGEQAPVQATAGAQAQGVPVRPAARAESPKAAAPDPVAGPGAPDFGQLPGAPDPGRLPPDLPPLAATRPDTVMRPPMITSSGPDLGTADFGAADFGPLPDLPPPAVPSPPPGPVVMDPAAAERYVLAAGSPIPDRSSTTAEQREFTAALGPAYTDSITTVNAALAAWPALRQDSSLAAKTDLVAVRLYFGSSPVGAGPLNLGLRSGRAPALPGYLSCLASGLRRLPPCRRAMLCQGRLDVPARQLYPEGTMLVEPAFRNVSGAGDIAVAGADVDYLVWSRTARQAGALSEHQELDEAVFLAGARFKVLAVREGKPRESEDVTIPGTAVLLREVLPGEQSGPGLDDADRTALSRLERALKRRHAVAPRALTDAEAIDRLLGPPMGYVDVRAGSA